MPDETVIEEVWMSLNLGENMQTEEVWMSLDGSLFVVASFVRDGLEFLLVDGGESCSPFIANTNMLAHGGLECLGEL